MCPRPRLAPGLRAEGEQGSGAAPADGGYTAGMAQARRISVDVPEALADASASDLAARLRLLLLIDEVRAGRMTRAEAADALGMALDDFVIEAGKHGLYAIDYDFEDFRRELDEISARS